MAKRFHHPHSSPKGFPQRKEIKEDPLGQERAKVEARLSEKIRENMASLSEDQRIDLVSALMELWDSLKMAGKAGDFDDRVEWYVQELQQNDSYSLRRASGRIFDAITREAKQIQWDAIHASEIVERDKQARIKLVARRTLSDSIAALDLQYAPRDEDLGRRRDVRRRGGPRGMGS